MTQPPSTSDSDTRQRLIDAAGTIFAEHGFRAATVRDICKRAGARNVAAIHYHFGDKETLYREVLESALRKALERYPPDYGLPANPTSEERLHAFVHSFLLRVFSDAEPTPLMRMMMREMVEPTGALDRLVERVHRPLFLELRGIVAEIAGANVPPERITACSQAVVAQCIFYRHAAHVIERMGHRVPSTRPEIDALAEQITRFSVAGIRARARGEVA
jgi:AcrR family transcriptional regulator